MPHTPHIPDLPGELVSQPIDLRTFVANLCHVNNIKFPGSQPVSFAQKDLSILESEDYWVCEKSDGVRVLFFIYTIDNKNQEVFIIDRHNQYRHLTGFFFPHYVKKELPLASTIIDGELVIDTDPHTGKETLRLLAFDCLVIDNQNVMSRTLDKRYWRLQEWFYKPYKRMIQDHPHMVHSQPFDIKVKGMELSYGLDKVFNEDIPKLQHGNDGLIYTCVQSQYVVGTDPKILKWKPPSENTIDFKLVLRFPPDPENPSEPDFMSRPVFGLHVYVGGRDIYEPFDELYVDDDEWESLKASGEQVDDRVVEVYWVSKENRWRMMRFRDDKPNGNHKSVVDSIISSIRDGVEKADLLARKDAIRTAWKARAARPPPPPPPAKPHPSIPGPPYPNNHQHSHSHPHTARPGPSDSFTSRSAPTHIDLRYGPLQESPFSRVGGPPVVLGFNR